MCVSSWYKPASAVPCYSKSVQSSPCCHHPPVQPPTLFHSPYSCLSLPINATHCSRTRSFSLCSRGGCGRHHVQGDWSHTETPPCPIPTAREQCSKNHNHLLQPHPTALKRALRPIKPMLTNTNILSCSKPPHNTGSLAGGSKTLRSSGLQGSGRRGQVGKCSIVWTASHSHIELAHRCCTPTSP